MLRKKFFLKKFVLGTANFSMKYGIKNKKSFLKKNSINKILKELVKSKILFIDTAKAYGKTEKNLGNFNLKKFKIITKINYIKKGFNTKEEIFKSLNNLKVKKLYGVLIHNTKILKNSNGKRVYRDLINLKKKGFIKKIGYSINSPKELSSYFKKFKPDIIQTPLNVFDQRILNSGWMSKLLSKKTEIHIRSIFLQGLLLIKKNKMPKKFLVYKKDFNKWHSWLKENKMSQLEGCLNFASYQKQVSKVVIGVDSVNQLKKILHTKIKNEKLNFSILETNKSKLINPRLW